MRHKKVTCLYVEERRQTERPQGLGRGRKFSHFGIELETVSWDLQSLDLSMRISIAALPNSATAATASPLFLVATLGQEFGGTGRNGGPAAKYSRSKDSLAEPRVLSLRSLWHWRGTPKCKPSRDKDCLSR